MKIRQYQTSDQPSIVSLWTNVFPNSTGHNDPAMAIERKVRADDDLFFVAVDNDSIIATVLAGYDGHRGWLYSLAVTPDRRRHGIGTKLVRHAEAALAAMGCQKLNLQVRTDNPEVVAFYESLGFRTEERISMGKVMRLATQ